MSLGIAKPSALATAAAAAAPIIVRIA